VTRRAGSVVCGEDREAAPEKLEDEIFRGFDFFSAIVSEFAFSFSRVGKTGFDRYLEINTTLLWFFNEEYPELADPQARIGSSTKG
jgi:hypothetical protein